MTTSQTKYAIDLSNEGVALWHRDEKGKWALLGKVALDAPNFSDDVENLKNGHTDDGALIARVRIPRSEVFVSEIDLNGSKNDAVEAKVKGFLSEKTPYSADELFYDLDQSTNGGPSYVAAVTKQTISEAKDFVTGHGFHAAYYTTKFDKSDFPRDARFYDRTSPPVISTKPEKIKEPKAEFVEVEKIVEAEPIPTPPTPKPIKAPNAKEETTEAVGEKEELPVAEKTDFSAFETVRRKELVAPKKASDKKEPTLPKVNIPAPAPRLSIGMTDADAKRGPEKTIGLTAGALKTPQGNTAKDSVKGKIKPRHIIILIALALIAAAYWFFTTLFDGKEEIARLNELPAPEVVVEEPQIAEVGPTPDDDIAPTVETDVAVTPEETIVVEATPEPVEVTEATPTTEQDLNASTQGAETAKTATDPVNEEVVQAEATDEEPTIVEPDVIAEVTPEQTEIVEGQQAETVVVEETTDEIPEQVDVAAAEPEETPAVTSASEAATIEAPLADLIPTKDGTLGAEGITLFAGVPDIIPPVREQLKISPDPLKDIRPRMRSADFAEVHKDEIEAVAQQLALAETQAAEEAVVPTEDALLAEEQTETTTEDAQEVDLLALADPELKTLQPRPRPAVIADRVKEIAAAALAPPADPALAGLKPRRRPSNLIIVKEEIQPERVDPSEIEVAIQEAVRDIARPRARPSNLSRKAANLQAAEKENAKKESIQTAALTPSTARGTSKPSSATAASVQRNATERGGINKRRISLIGVYGKASSRRALVRMPNGRYVKVKSGQKFSGWKVSAIGESSVRITKGSRNQVLRMPKR